MIRNFELLQWKFQIILDLLRNFDNIWKNWTFAIKFLELLRNFYKTSQTAKFPSFSYPQTNFPPLISAFKSSFLLSFSFPLPQSL